MVGKGFLGEKIKNVFSEKDLQISTAGIEKGCDAVLDLTNREKTIELIKKLNPNTIILTASISNVDYCELHPKEAESVNMLGTRNIVDACKETKSKLVFFSTDYVFDGAKGKYNEEDSCNPINHYGKTKEEGEKIVKELEDSLILRPSTLYGFNSLDDKNTFVKFVVKQISQNQEVSASTQITSPTLIDDLADATLNLIEKNAKGVFHTAGSEAISRYDLAKKIAEIFSLDESKIKKVDLIPGAKARRPENSSLDIKKLTEEEISMSTIELGLKKLKFQLKEVKFI
ncbi:MAG: SDR family oxidoreductase [archaeon]